MWTANFAGTISVLKKLSGKTYSTFLQYHKFVYINKLFLKDFPKFPSGPQRPGMWARWAGGLSISARRLRRLVRAVGQHSTSTRFKTCAKHVVYGMQCLVLWFAFSSSGFQRKLPSQLKTFVLVCNECGVQDGWYVVKRVKHVMYVMHCLFLWIATWLVLNVNMYAGRMDNEWSLSQRGYQCQRPTVQLCY